MALAIDSSSPALVQANAQTVTTASFTPPSGAVLYAEALHASSLSGTVTNSTITDTAGLTWTLRADSNLPTPSGSLARLWTATVVTSAPMTVTITTTSNGYNGIVLNVLVATDADSTSPTQFVAIGRTTLINQAISGNGGALSRIFNIDYGGVGAFTPTASTIEDYDTAPGSDRMWGAHGARLTASGTVTLATTAPAAGTQNQWVGYSMAPASPALTFGDPTADSPPFVAANSARTVTTASFTPDTSAGPVLLVAVAWHDTAGGNLTNTSVVTDSRGLTWTKRVARSKGDDGGAAQNAHVQMSWAIVPQGTPTAMTVTTTGTNTNNPAGLKVFAHVGFDPANPIGASSENSSTANASLALTTANNGERVYMALSDWNVTATPTPGPDQIALVGASIGAPDVRVYASVQSGVTPTAGTSVTSSTLTPASGTANNVIAWSINPAVGGGPVTHNATGTAAGTATASGTSNLSAVGAGTAAGAAGASGAATRSTAAAGTAAGSSAATGTATRSTATTGSAAGSASASGAATVSRQAVGAGAGSAGASGVASVALGATATAPAMAGSLGNAALTIPTSGASAGVASLSGSATLALTASGAAAGTGPASGAATVGGAGAAGIAAGSGSSVGTATVERYAAGIAAGVAANPGTASVVRSATGSPTGAASATGTSTVANTSLPTTGGVGSAAGAAAVVKVASGVSAGVGTALGAATAIRMAAGVAAGVASANGTAGFPALAIGAAASTGLMSGVAEIVGPIAPVIPATYVRTRTTSPWSRTRTGRTWTRTTVRRA